MVGIIYFIYGLGGKDWIGQESGPPCSPACLSSASILYNQKRVPDRPQEKGPLLSVSP